MESYEVKQIVTYVTTVEANNRAEAIEKLERMERWMEEDAIEAYDETLLDEIDFQGTTRISTQIVTNEIAHKRG